MLCKIADLIAEIPAAGGMASRCKDYLYEGAGKPQIVIREEDYRPERWSQLSGEGLCYMDSGLIFYVHLLQHDGLMLHSSAIELDGKAYLFSGDSGAGKSTHTSLWMQKFGPAARIFNDDKPALRFIDGRWYAYGTPWSGKNGINENIRVPLAGICFLKKAPLNRIRRLDPREAVMHIVRQTQRRFQRIENLDMMLHQVERLLQSIPVFELENRPEQEAVRLSYETMRRCAEEMGL